MNTRYTDATVGGCDKSGELVLNIRQSQSSPDLNGQPECLPESVPSLPTFLTLSAPNFVWGDSDAEVFFCQL